MAAAFRVSNGEGPTGLRVRDGCFPLLGVAPRCFLGSDFWRRLYVDGADETFETNFCVALLWSGVMQ